MACALGLDLTPRAGALYAMQGQRVVFDGCWPRVEREAIIARAYAVYALHHAGLLRTSGEGDIAWLARALCGVELPGTASLGACVAANVQAAQARVSAAL